MADEQKQKATVNPGAKASKETDTGWKAGGDRVAMLSVRKDGEHDQLDPTFIGDKEFATAATKRQFAEQAVSAADDAAQVQRLADESADTDVEQDPAIAERIEEHEQVQSDAEQRAEQVVDKLHES